MKWLEEKRVQVEHVERPIDNFVQVFISPHSNYWQVALASIYVCISVCWASRKFWGAACMLHNFPFVYTTSVALLPLSHGWVRSKLQWETLQHLLDVSRDLMILDLCSERTWTATSPHNTAKGVACETRSELPPSSASMAVGSTPRAKIMCLLALMNVRNATSPCSRFCCTNNRIMISFLRVWTN